jgi:hypothetical protein
VDEIGEINRAAARCPNCGAEYRTGFDVCSDCGVELVALDSIGARGTVGQGSIEVLERATADGGGGSTRGEAASDAEPTDLFSAEEHPLRLVLARLDAADAADVADRLEAAGIGARVGDPDAEGFVPVVVHDTRLPEAQALLADLGFAPWAEAEPIDADDEDTDGEETAAPAHDDHPFVIVTRNFVGAAWENARRVAAAGIDVRMLVDRYPAPADSSVEVLVPADRLDEARSILHIER